MEELQEVLIKKVGVLSFAYISAIIGVFIGLIFGLLTITAILFLPTIPYIGTYSSFGYLSIVVFPIAYGILGFIFGILGALFYNLATKIAKGIKLYS